MVDAAPTTTPIVPQAFAPPNDPTPADHRLSPNDSPDLHASTEFALAQVILGRLGDRRIRKIAALLLSQQHESGGWGSTPTTNPCLDLTLKSYLTIRLAGHPDHHPLLHRAARFVRQFGGCSAASGRTKIFLAALGLIPYASAPTIPVEAIFQPTWSPFFIPHPSASTKQMLLPLAVVTSSKPITPIAGLIRADEIGARIAHPTPPEPLRGRLFAWNNAAPIIDRSWKKIERFVANLHRPQALREAESLLLEPNVADTPTIDVALSRLALRCIGHADDSPAVGRREQSDERRLRENREHAFLSTSPAPPAYVTMAPAETFLFRYAQALGVLLPIESASNTPMTQAD